MAKVFISHASKDAVLATVVRRWLVDDGHKAFLDHDLSDGLVVGEEWERRLRERLRWADAVVCVLTSAYLASVWCTAELTIAQSRGSRLLPLRAEPGVRHPLLDSVQDVDMTIDAAAARARVAEALLRVDAAGGYGWPDDRSPFPGLRPLDTDEHSVFFGRARELEQLATLLRSPAERADPAALVIVGPSGCGKSSLVRAGLLPVMAAELEWWTLPAMLPGTRPIAALARELGASAKQVGLAWTVTDVRHRLAEDGLGGLVEDLLHAVPGQRRRHLLLVVDQFEELLTQTGAEERAGFAELLRDALDGPVQVVATLRPEFLDQLLASPEISALPARTHALRPLRPEALRAVIEGPADRAGITIDDDLVTRLVSDTGGGEALPLLAYTLAQLIDGVPHGGRLSAVRYEQLGEVPGVLAGQADAALVVAVTTGGRAPDQVVKELLRLVTVDEQGRPTRWRIRRDEIPDSVLTELEPFVDRRLLTTDAEDDHVVLGVAHEAFLSAWPPLNEAITAAASALRARRQVEQATAQWIEDSHAPTRLWERGQLAAALADTGARLQSDRRALKAAPAGDEPVPQRRSRFRWRRQRVVVTDRVELSAHARDFLAASIRRARRRRGRAITILSMLLVLALGAAVWLAIAPVREAWLQQQAQNLSPTVLLPGRSATVGPGDRRVTFPPLSVDLHEVTNQQYRLCVQARRCAPPEEPYNDEKYVRGDRLRPVVYVTAYHAATFCSWIGRRLPTEAEWERVARGTDGRRFPWGDARPGPGQVNAILAGHQPTGLVPVDVPGFERGRSADRVEHLLGNAAEWTATRGRDTGTDQPERQGDWNGRDRVMSLVVKGGGWQEDVYDARYASIADAIFPDAETGFRCIATTR